MDVKCVGCGQIKPSSDFYSSYKGNRCKECLKARSRRRAAAGALLELANAFFACADCGETKAASEFYPTQRVGKTHRCKSCTIKKMKIYNKTSEKRKAAEARRMERLKTDEAARKQRNDYQRQRIAELSYRKNLVHSLLAGHWRKTHPELAARIEVELRLQRKHQKLLNARRQNSNPARREYHRAYKAANRALMNSYENNRRAAKLGSEAVNDEAIRDIYRLAKSHFLVPCYICGKETERDDRHVDHKMPLTRGGTHTADNLAIACKACNLSKKDRTLEEHLLITQGTVHA